MKNLLRRCAETALNSKLVARHKEFFSKMVCEAVMHLDELLPLNMIGVKKVQGGALEVSLKNIFLDSEKKFYMLFYIILLGRYEILTLV